MDASLSDVGVVFQCSSVSCCNRFSSVQFSSCFCSTLDSLQLYIRVYGWVSKSTVGKCSERGFISAHIFFDDAWEDQAECGRTPNAFFRCLFRLLLELTQYVLPLLFTSTGMTEASACWECERGLLPDCSVCCYFCQSVSKNRPVSFKYSTVVCFWQYS